MFADLRRLLTDPQRRVLVAHLVAVATLLGVHLGLQLVLRRWTIEDAAISYAFAHNLASGEGLVAVAGGERVEGYSNPTWVALLTLADALGGDLFVVAKVIGAACGAATVAVVWDLLRRARGKLDAVPLIGAALVATNAQAVIWGASGLESALFSLLLALAIRAADRDVRERRWMPWSALFFLLLALTRPEGLLYAAVGGGFLALAALRDGGRGAVRFVARWLGVFFGPFVAYHALRYSYFAWPLPNTYYAKLEDADADWGAWAGEGWKYVRGYAWESRHGLLLPVYALALAPPRRRWWSVVGWTIALYFGAALLLQGLGGTPLAALALPWPKSLAALRVWGTVAVALGFVTASVVERDSAWRVRTLCGLLAITGLFFAIYGRGDWMRGYRWLSLVSVPMSVLLALGLGELAGLGAVLPWRVSRAPRVRLGVGVALAVGAGAVVVAPAVQSVGRYAARPETGPYAIKQRVDYNTFLMRRLEVDRPWGLDVDMGANMVWGGWRLVDTAGLIDVPIAHHDYEALFVRSYLFQERRLDFAHVHGGWEQRSRFRTHPEWDERFIEVPGYPAGKTGFHTGNHVRRDLLFADHWEGPPGREVDLADGVRVVGWSLPVATGAAGRNLAIEIGLASRPRVEGEDVHLLLFLSNRAGRIVSFELTPTFGWIPEEQWPEGVVHRVRASVRLPSDLPVGRYDLGLAVRGRDGFLAVEAAPQDVVTEPALLVRGEVRWPDAVEILTPTERDRLGESLGDEVIRAAKAGDCALAERRWLQVRAATSRQFARLEALRERVRGDVSTCYAERAPQRAPLDRVADLTLAQAWDHRASAYLREASPVADALVEQGHAAARVGDWASAKRDFLGAVSVWPTHAWARRWAEEARDRLDGRTAADQPLAKVAQARTFEAALAKHGVGPSPAKQAEPPAVAAEELAWTWSGSRGGLPWGGFAAGALLWGALVGAGRRWGGRW